jgi:anti-sigma B factor antagonist
MWQESKESDSRVSAAATLTPTWGDRSASRIDPDQPRPGASLQLVLSHVREIARGHGLWSGFREGWGLSIRSEKGNGTARLVLSGELDYASAPLIDEFLAIAQAEHESVVVDLENLMFMDSSGIEVFLHAAKRAEDRDGRMRVVNSNMHRRVFVLCGAESLLGEEERSLS